MHFSLSAGSHTDFESPHLFFGELKSGLFHLSSDLSRVLGTDPAHSCRLEEVFDALLANECDREVLRAFFDELRRECASRDLFVRLRLEGRVLWCRIRAKSYRSDAGDRTLFAGTVEFYNFARIFSELLGFSDFTKEEVEKLVRLASAPVSHTISALRLTSNFRATDSLGLFTAQIAESMREKASDGVVIEQFDFDTLLISTPETSFDVEARANWLLDAVLREHRADTDVEPRLLFAEGAESYVEAMEKRIVFWLEFANLYPTTNAPEKFQLREILLTACACLNDFEGFKLLMQPLVDRYTRHYTGAEFLLRFKADRGFGPDRFVRLLEKSTLAVPLTHWVFGHSLELASKILKAAPEGFTFNLNLNPMHTVDWSLFLFLRTAAERNGIPFRRIVVEFVETGENIPQQDLLALIEKCRSLSMQTAIDDFGTCYNSLAFLLSMPCDMVKLSREIALGCLYDEKRRQFLCRLIKAFKELGLVVCIEGIQDEEMYARLEGLAPDQLQGYCFAKPSNAEEMLALLLEASVVGAGEASA